MSIAAAAETMSDAARRRMLSVRGEPLFYARWDEALMIHYEADPDALQRCVPFALDLRDGRAFASLVAFTMRRMRPRPGGRLAEWLVKPIGSHEFLNLRTYVRVRGEPGIYFMAEWLSNRLSVPLGPPLFGLPYRYGRVCYNHSGEATDMTGCVTSSEGSFAYRVPMWGMRSFEPCTPGSLDEFLMERYTAFTEYRRLARFFRVWHEPWPQSQIEVAITASDLLSSTGNWWKTAQHVSANYSPGVDVWMGRPLRVR